jgi:uncharacterized membrane protein
MALYYLVAIIGIAVIVWLIAKKVSLRWYEWLLGIVGYLLALLALQNWAASLQELQPRAGGLLLLMIGLPALVLIAISIALPLTRARKGAS